ncbi:MAG: DUF3667 domain-containing protein [Acidobacteriota bacterium]
MSEERVEEVSSGEEAPETTTPTCLNCRAELVGPYCAACGQRHRGERLTARELVQELLETLLSVDSRLWRTLVDLSHRPGLMARHYVWGARRRYLNPMGYLLACVAFYYLLASVTGFNSMEVWRPIEGEPLPADGFMGFLQENERILITGTVPLLVVFFTLAFWSCDRTLAESAAFTAFVTGHATLLGAMLFPTVLLVPESLLWALPIYLLASTVYYTWAARSFYGVSLWAATWRTLLVMMGWMILGNTIGMALMFIAWKILK